MTHSIVAILVVVGLDYVAFLVTMYILIHRVNRKRRADEQIPLVGFRFWTVLREYRRLYPGDPLYGTLWILLGLLWGCGLVLFLILRFSGGQ